MATSGSWDYSLTAADIIKSAYEDLGVVSPGGTVPSVDSVMALTRLNMIVKQYQGTSDGSPGVKVHTRQRLTLFLAYGQQTYLIGPAATDSRATASYGRTTVSALEDAGQTVISITSNTDSVTTPESAKTMANADIVGIQLDSGVIHWSTISGTPSTTMTIVDALPTQASSGKYVYWFTSRAQRFPTLEAAVLRDSDYNDTPLEIYTDVGQYDLGVTSKYADGTPTSLLCEPLRLNTRITFNSQPTDVSKQVVLTVLYPAEDYDATTNDIAFPQEALRFLSWELAFALSPSVGRWTPEMEMNRKEARSMYLNLNPETSVMYFQPG